MLLLQSPGNHIPSFALWRASSITDPTQACDTSFSCQKIESRMIDPFLHMCLAVPADTKSLGHVFQTQIRKPARLAPADSNHPDRHLSGTRGQQNTQQKETTIIVTILTDDDSLSQVTKLLLLRAPSPPNGTCLFEILLPA